MSDFGAVLETVRATWGFDELRPLQRRAIEAGLDGRDSVVVLPTGGGKSLCYQAPALVSEGLTLVVSPLIALMKDQVDALVANGVAAAFWNSTLSAADVRKVEDDLRNRRLKLLYAAPERVAGDAGPRFRKLLAESGLTSVAVDEAHCISQWGHDFRPEYRRLALFRQEMPEIPIHAYTATATPRVREDIVRQLELRDPEVLVGAVDRDNLVYRVHLRGAGADPLKRVLDRNPDGAGIVYCLSRKETERVAKRLEDSGVSARPYHAGLADDERSACQEAFLAERLQVVVATVAFGMGIDRPDVRFVVHLGAPRSLEHYQQESGRAGRDGLTAECVLVYSPADFAGWRRRLESEGSLDERGRSLLADMHRFAAGMHCRHRALSEYFGQSLDSDDCGACDWCLGELEEVGDAIVLGQKILSCVVRVDQRWGTGHVMDVLRGVRTEKVEAQRHDELSTFGLLEGMAVGELRGYVEQLIDAGLLLQQGDRYPTLGLSADGLAVLRGEAGCRLFRQERPEPSRRRRAAARRDAPAWDGVDTDLFEALRDLRRALAEERGVPAYVIFHDATLRELAQARPRTPAELLGVFGVGEKKAETFGPVFLDAIARHAAASEDGG